jgi:hypothetical protein
LHYQAYNSPCVLVGDEFMHLRPEESDENDTRREQANGDEKILPVERSHQRELWKLDTGLEKLMELFCIHATAISLAIH